MRIEAEVDPLTGGLKRISDQRFHVARRERGERAIDLRDRRVEMSDGPQDVGALVRQLVNDGALTGATLSRPRRSDPARPSRVTVTPKRCIKFKVISM